jgi:pimeloyl-ACP methyl ester carboxylesterase
MSMSVQSYVVPTSHATISVCESVGTGPAVVMIHGNSCCKEVFRNQMDGAVGARWRVIALDLPGHGRSSDARNPWRSYTMPGYADMVAELLDILGVRRFAVFGWSLGGHIGLELFTRHAGMAGLMATGTPPVALTPEAIGQGFQVSEHMGMIGKVELTDAEAELFARHACGINAPFERFVLDAVRRTDGRARERMIAAAVSGWGTDQLRLAETLERPLAIVSGGDEPFVNNAYLQRIRYARLWDGQVHILPGIGHAPFWEAPALFDPLLSRFLTDVL